MSVEIFCTQQALRSANRPGTGPHGSDFFRAKQRATCRGTMSGKDRAVWSVRDNAEPVVTLHSGLYNGRLLTALPCTPGAEHTEQCFQRLQDCGIQILYISIWVNLYSTVQMFTSGQSWVTSIPVTLTAVLVTAAVILILNQQQKKINTNTDIMLAAANESFMKYNVLLGISDRSQSCRNAPSLCFIYFHLWGCQQRLSQHLASMHQDDVRHCLDQLFIVIEIPADPMFAQSSTEDPMTEESPLLASESRHKPVLFSQKTPLILWDEPEVMARQLLVIASACYVRLLIAGQLPKSYGARHTGILDVPCLCQFIENSILTSGRCITCI
ncbi:transmembrane protein 268 isoform X3 [Rana temporaria]|uniref:transmembrane protein 268 isoform X3 n=1 Tax=Rana temporaria TaxID=8407 RepID=UPI001AAD48AE|nr:transmembrane protein 268 isoform X3 [Rana temporaria]